MDQLDFLVQDDTYVGIFVVLDKELRIQTANNRFTELTNYSINEIRDMKFTDLILPNDKSLFFDVLYDSMVTQDITIKLYNKTGAFRFYSIIVQSFNTHFLIMGNPIKKDFIGYDYHSELVANTSTQFKEIEVEDIKDFIGFESEAFLFILDAMPIDIWIKSRYGKYIYINKTFTTHTGHTLAYAHMKTDYELFDPDIAKEFETSDNTAIQSKDVLNYVFESKSEKLLTWTEVTKIPIFNKDGAYIGIIGFSSDITSYKSLENEFKESTNRYQELIKRLDELVFEINQKGDFIFLSGKLVEELKLEPNQLISAKEIISKFGTGTEMEKINLALTGSNVSFPLTINKTNLHIEIYPLKIDDTKNHLIGFGKKV